MAARPAGDGESGTDGARDGDGDGGAEMMASSAAESYAARIAAAVEAILALRTGIEAAAPLGPDAALGDGEDTWGPREVLGHVTEATAYWHGEIERVLAGPAGAPVPFGRSPGDVARVAILARDRSLPAFVLLDRLARESAALTARVARLTDAELARQGLHPVRGVWTVADLVERTLAGPFEGHVGQIRALLAS
jgi:hypothetical protein